MNTLNIIQLSIWDVMDFKILNKILNIKGYSEDFVFDPICEKDINFELTIDEFKQLGINKRKERELLN